MFFSGEGNSRKRVDLGGRSSKERNRQALLEQTLQERKRRLDQRQQNAAATAIQKIFRGRKAVEDERSKVRERFYLTFGTSCENLNQHSFGPESNFLQSLLFFLKVDNNDDFEFLVKACTMLLQFLLRGDTVCIFAGNEYTSKRSLVDCRVKKFVLLCLKAAYHNRSSLREESWKHSHLLNPPTIILLDTVAALLNAELPWACQIAEYLLKKKAFYLMRGIAISVMGNVDKPEPQESRTSFESVLFLMISHVCEHPCTCRNVVTEWNFWSQLLTLPFVWHHLTHLKKGFGRHYIHQMSVSLPNNAIILPNDVMQGYPSYACLLGNILEAAGDFLSKAQCSYQTVVEFMEVSTFLLESIPLTSSLAKKEMVEYEDKMDEDAKDVLNAKLVRQITSAIDSCFLMYLVNILFAHNGLHDSDCPSNEEADAIYALCAFLHVIFLTLPLERIMTVLAYRTDVVHVLWTFIKRCHLNQKWPVPSKLLEHISGDATCLLLSLAVFCPIYKHMLTIVDNEEFHEQEKPLSLEDLRLLIVVLKQTLWQLLWMLPGTTLSSSKSSVMLPGHDKLSCEAIRHRVRIVASDLLNQLQDWNSRRNFTSDSDFHVKEAASESFVSQVLQGNKKASDILKYAPFLVPFTSRVRIFTSQLATSKQTSQGLHILPRSRFKIRRNRILEDAFSQLNALPDEALRGPIRVSFVNELGLEEAGIDGGGIFKDFMENITRTAFNVQYGLFKETADHLLYPNPASGLIHEQHLQFFRFLGSLLGKAMYEGILVDIPFAAFFLSKIKQKHNYLNDLPSLDPELYRHLLFLKNYKGDVEELELYFVITNNEYGEQKEVELLPDGKNIRVTNANVITFIHLTSNYHLNIQIRSQSSFFLRGFMLLIQEEWIDMFNEHEIQLLISGSLESMDVDELRDNTHYSGGYQADDSVILMFWQIVKELSLDYQKKFLKFVTGCSRGPLLGFKYLEPKFCILRAGPQNFADEDFDRLPTSATCMNLLKLPPYRSKEQMRSKMIYAISADAGFDLS